MLSSIYIAIDVNRISDNQLREQMLSGLVAYTLKHRKMADFKQFLTEFMPWASEVEVHSHAGASLTRTLLTYIITRVSQGDKDFFIQEAQRYLSSDLQDDIMTIAQQWEAEGIRKGMQQGEVAMLMRLIRHRFGEVPNSIMQQITQADTQTLLRLGEKVLDANKLEEIFLEETY